jgi:2-dehydropantoate 2-reductase
MKTVTIVGAGAMGSLFAARLAEAGAVVSVVDVDRDRLAAINRDGITLHDDMGERTVPVQAVLAADAAGPVDLLIMFTKGMHSESATASVAHLASASTYALTLQNGLGNAEILAATFGSAQTLVGVTDFPADLQGPTRVSSHGAGHVWLGAFASGSVASVDGAVALLNEAGLNAVADAAVQVSIWEKVAFNAALNSLAMITGLTVGGMDMPAGRRVATAVVGEVVATAAALGLVLDQDAISAKIDFALANHRGHKASMLQDFLARRPTEIETINGAVVRIADAHGVATPVTATLANIVRLMEKPGAV